jgi:phosphoglycolate phosphatase
VVASHFVSLVGDDDMPAPKPDPRGLLGILERAACPGSCAVYVGDSRTDLQTARAANIRAIGVSWGAHARHELEALEFDAIVDTPPQLVTVLKSLW